MKSEFTKFSGINSITMNDYMQRHDKIIGASSSGTIVGMTPHVIEERQLNAIAMSVFDRLMMDRIIFIGMPIDDTVANIVNAQLLFLESLDNEKDISIYINSPGGGVYAGLGIYDVMNYLKVDIATINTGIAASMAAVLLCAGSKEKRQSLPHARTMIHQPMGAAQGQASDIEIMSKEIQKVKKELYQIIAKHSGKSLEQVEKDGDRDCWMVAEEAKDYGLIDGILKSRK